MTRMAHSSLVTPSRSLPAHHRLQRLTFYSNGHLGWAGLGRNYVARFAIRGAEFSRFHKSPVVANLALKSKQVVIIDELNNRSWIMSQCGMSTFRLRSGLVARKVKRGAGTKRKGWNPQRNVAMQVQTEATGSQDERSLATGTDSGGRCGGRPLSVEEDET
jgi:hypothetical protein